MSRVIGIDRLCVFDMPPVQFVETVAELDCRSVGFGLEPMGAFDQGYPDWSLKTDAVLRRDLLSAARDLGVTLALCDSFGLVKGVEARDFAADLDVVAELDCHRINVVSTGRDLDRSVQGFGVLAAMAAEREIDVVIELGAGPVNSLDAALIAVQQVGRANFSILLDSMHYFRFGGTIEKLASIDPAVIGYVQLCDVPLQSSYDTYLEEAFFHRLPPGAGELPLVEFLGLIPAEVVVSLEVPQRSRTTTGDEARLLAELLDATRTLLAEI
jgi:sugar phosphate isomerase/epimerase